MGDVPTAEESREGYEAAMAVALAMTRSKQKADDLVQEAFERIYTTRPWKRGERQFREHAANVTRSLVLHSWVNKGENKDKEAHRGFHQEQVGFSAPSPEDRSVDRSEEEQRQSDADAELDALDASLEGNDMARSVLRCRREHGLVKAREIADKLGVPVEQVYRANNALKDHLRTIRKRRT